VRREGLQENLVRLPKQALQNLRYDSVNWYDLVMLKQKITTALTIEDFFMQREPDEQHEFLESMVEAWREDGYSDSFILELLQEHDDTLSGHVQSATRH